MTTAYLYGDDIAYLWFCGSKQLNYKLKEGGVRSFDISLKTWRPLVWPTLALSFNKLDSFGTSFAQNVSCRSLSNISLSFSSSLTKLHLHCYNAYSTFLDAICPVSAPATTRLPNLQDLWIDGTGSSNTEPREPFSTLFPSLQTLTIAWCDSDRFNQAAPMSSTHFALLLTPTLTSLENHWCLYISSGFDFNWPTGLTSLETKMLKDDGVGKFELFFPSLPSSLLHLKLHYSSTSTFSPVDTVWTLLPAYLLTLACRVDYVTPDHIRKLPRTLTELDLNSDCDLSELPPSITSMNCHRVDSPQSLPRGLLHCDWLLPASQIEHLPPKISSISFDIVGDDLIWPAHFHTNGTLKFIQSNGLTNTQLRALPSSVDSISFYDDPGPAGDLDVSLLPRNLTNLSGWANDSFSLAEKDAAELPRSLKTLQILFVERRQPAQPATASWTHTFTSGLPRHLTTLKMFGVSLPDGDVWVQGLPATLEILDISLHGQPLKPAIFALPCPNLSRFWIVWDDDTKWSISDHFHKLPRRVTSIGLRHDDEFGQIIPEEAFQQLPPGLVTFLFPTDSSQYKSCPILPRNLLHLRLGGQVPAWWKSTP
jgi:hypothetical protein